MVQPDEILPDELKDQSIIKADKAKKLEEETEELPLQDSLGAARESPPQVIEPEEQPTGEESPVDSTSAVSSAEEEAHQRDINRQKIYTEYTAREENAEEKAKVQERKKKQEDYARMHPSLNRWEEENVDKPGSSQVWYNLGSGTIVSRDDVEIWKEDLANLADKTDGVSLKRKADLELLLNRVNYIESLHPSDTGPEEEYSTSDFMVDPAIQQEAQGNKNQYGLQKMRIKGQIWYVLEDGTVVNEKDTDKLTPKQQSEIQAIDNDPLYADLVKPPVDYGAELARIGYTLADAFAYANLPKNVGKALGSFRVGLHAMLNGDMLGTAGAAVNASFNGLKIIGDGVDSFRAQIKRRYGVTSADGIIEAGKTMKDKLITHETARTKVAIGNALQEMVKAGGKAYGVRDVLINSGFQYDKQALLDAGLTPEGADLIDKTLKRTHDKGAGKTFLFSEEDKNDISYMLLYGDYGYKPELMGAFIAALNEQKEDPQNIRNVAATNPYYQALISNEQYDFRAGLGEIANIARVPMGDPVSQMESTMSYYKSLADFSEDIARKLRDAERGYSYVYNEDDREKTTPLLDKDGHPLTEKVEGMSSAERRILMATKQVYDQALVAIDGATGGIYASERSATVARERQERVMDKAFKQSLIDKYKSEPQGGAYQILAGKQDGIVAYEDLFPSLQIPQDRFDKNGNSSFAKMDDLWRKIQATSEQASDLLKNNQQYASLHNAWACMDAYRTYTTLVTAVVSINPENAEVLIEGLGDYLEKVCSENRWQGGDLTASNYTRMDMNKWLLDNLGMETEVLEDRELNHIISGCGIDGEVGVSPRGGPVFSEDVPMSKVNLLVDYDAIDRISGLAKRYIDLQSKVDSGKSLSSSEFRDYKRLKVFRAYQLRERTLAELRGLADAPDVKAILKSVENQDAFRHAIMDTLGKNPGWKWKDGEITENWDFPSDGEATFENIGYGHWDFNTKAGRIAVLKWLKGLATKEGVEIGIDVEEIGVRRKKGLGEFMDPPEKKSSSRGYKGKFKISASCHSEVEKQIDRRLNSDYESIKLGAQQVKGSIDKGEISLERIQYAVDNGMIKPITLDGEQSFSEIYTGMMGEIVALEKLGYISKTRDWIGQAKAILADSLFAAPEEGDDYFDAIKARVGKICTDPTSKGVEYSNRIQEKIEEIKGEASDAEKAGDPWNAEKKLNEVLGECKEGLYLLMDKEFRQAVPNTAKTNTRAENKKLSETLETAHECLQDNDLKEYILGKFVKGVPIDPATGLIHKETANKVRSNRDMVKSIRADIQEFISKWDANSSDAEHDREFIKKLTALVDVIEITEKVFADSVKAGVHLPDDWALSVEGAPTKASQFVSEVISLRNTMGQSFGEFATDLEREGFEAKWHEIGVRYGIRFEKVNAVKASELNDWKMKMRANGGVIDTTSEAPEILERHADATKDGIDKLLGAIIENAKRGVKWPAEVFHRGADGEIGGEFVTGYDEGGAYSAYLKAMGIDPFYIPDPEYPGDGIRVQDSTDPALREKYLQDDALINSTVKNWQNEVDTVSKTAFNKLMYNTKLDIVVKNHTAKTELSPFRGNNKKGDARRLKFEGDWKTHATDQDRTELKEAVLNPEFIRTSVDLVSLENASLEAWDAIRANALKALGEEFTNEEKSEVIKALWDKSGLASRTYTQEGDTYRPFKEGDAIPESPLGYLDVSPSAVLRAIGEGASHQDMRYTNFIKQHLARTQGIANPLSREDEADDGVYSEVDMGRVKEELESLRFSGKTGAFTQGDLEKLVNNLKQKRDTEPLKYLFETKGRRDQATYESKLGLYLNGLAKDPNRLDEEFLRIYKDILGRKPDKDMSNLINDPRSMLTAIAATYMSVATGKPQNAAPLYDKRKYSEEALWQKAIELMDKYAPASEFQTESVIRGLSEDSVGDVAISAGDEALAEEVEDNSRKSELEALKTATFGLKDNQEMIAAWRKKFGLGDMEAKVTDEAALKVFLSLVNGSMHDLNEVFGLTSGLNEAYYTPQEKCEYIADFTWRLKYPTGNYRSALKSWRSKCIAAWDEWKKDHDKDNRERYLEALNAKNESKTVDQSLRTNLDVVGLTYQNVMGKIWAVGSGAAGDLGRRTHSNLSRAQWEVKDNETLSGILNAKSRWEEKAKRLLFSAVTGHKIVQRKDTNGKKHYVDADAGDALINDNYYKRTLESMYPGFYDTMINLLETQYKHSLHEIQDSIRKRFNKDYGGEDTPQKKKTWFWVHNDPEMIYGNNGVLAALGIENAEREEMRRIVEKQRTQDVPQTAKERKKLEALQHQYNFFNYYTGSEEYNQEYSNGKVLTNSKFGRMVQSKDTLSGMINIVSQKIIPDWGAALKNKKSLKKFFNDYVSKVTEALTKPGSDYAKKIKAQTELSHNPMPEGYLEDAIRGLCWQKLDSVIEGRKLKDKLKMPEVSFKGDWNRNILFKDLFAKKPEEEKEEKPAEQEPPAEQVAEAIANPVKEENPQKEEPVKEEGERKLTVNEISALWKPLSVLNINQIAEEDKKDWTSISRLIKGLKYSSIANSAERTKILRTLAEKYKGVEPTPEEEGSVKGRQITSAELAVEKENARILEEAKRKNEEKAKELEEREKILEGTGEDLFGERPSTVAEIQAKFFDTVSDEAEAKEMAKAYGLDVDLLQKAYRKVLNGDKEGARNMIASAAAEAGIFKSASKVLRPKSSIRKSTAKVLRPKRT